MSVLSRLKRRLATVVGQNALLKQKKKKKKKSKFSNYVKINKNHILFPDLSVTFVDNLVQ